MKRLLGAALAGVLLASFGGAARADDKEAVAVVDKALKALGGEEKLSKVTAYTTKAKGTISIMGTDNAFTSQGTVQGTDHARNEFEGEFGGMQIKGVAVIAGDKGWRSFAGMGMEMDKDALANEKRSLYLQIVAFSPGLLKGKGYKVATAKEEAVGGKPAVVLKVTGPDGKDFTMYYDKESGLPVRQVAKVIDGFTGNELTQDTTFSDYKDMAGLKRAAKVEIKRDGEKFLTQEITEFKVLDKVDPKTFEEPK